MKRILFTIGGAAGLLVLVALAILLFVDANRYKPELEAVATDALGMEVRVDGKLSIGLFPGFHLTLEDSRILGNQGVAVASAKRVVLWAELLPALRKKIRIRRIELRELSLSVERDREGRFNVERLKRAMTLLGSLDRASVSLSGGVLRYADTRSGEGFEATNIDLGVSRVRIAERGSPQTLKRLSFRAELTCGEVRTKNLSVSALKITAVEKDGIFELTPVTMRIFGGQMAGDIRADFTAPVPLCQIRCSLPQFRIEEFLRTLSPKRAVEGAMDFTASLSMQGKTMSQMVQASAGDVSLRGEDLMLEGNDLDGRLSRFESSQNFNLVDVGAVFFAGPLGLAVTKGYTFAGLFQGSGGSSRIHTLVSSWRVERGVAQAKDVALATTENRIALHGGLDFVEGRFADVTVAVVDAGGCATVRQTIRGSFGRPEVEKPDVLKSLSGPFRKLYKQARGLFPSGPCKVFYAGSVAPPG
jgi:AsmA protein